MGVAGAAKVVAIRVVACARLRVRVAVADDCAVAIAAGVDVNMGMPAANVTFGVEERSAVGVADWIGEGRIPSVNKSAKAANAISPPAPTLLAMILHEGNKDVEGLTAASACRIASTF